MPIAEGLALYLQRLAEQRLCGGEVALGTQQPAEIADGDERRLVQQRLSGGEVALGLEQVAEVNDGGEHVRVSIAERLALHLHRLAAHSGSAAARSPFSCSWRMVSVFGCRLPSASRDTSSASRHSGSDLSLLPWTFSSTASLSKVTPVSSPSVRSA
eukprot:scaffold65513_cov64-Phaeocystis_antarctica.AAC.5